MIAAYYQSGLAVSAPPGASHLQSPEQRPALLVVEQLPVCDAAPLCWCLAIWLDASLLREDNLYKILYQYSV